MESNIQTKTAFLCSIIMCLSLTFVFGQSKKTDRLEQYYDQGHYKMVYRKASRLLKNPDFNYSVLPSYYRAMSSFQLMQNQSWFNRNNASVNQSVLLMTDVIKSDQWSRIMGSHSSELEDIEVVFDMWLAKNSDHLKEEKNRQLEDWILTVFREYEFETGNEEYRDEEGLVPEGLSVSKRNSLMHYAYEFIGIPYKWGGADENGFDCSGFTKHVFQGKGIDLPRVSQDQFNFAKKINVKRAFMGDLVFFSEGDGISHVGILVNQVNEPKKMIHSSSSKGISVADIEASDYWKKRIVAYGRIIR